MVKLAQGILNQYFARLPIKDEQAIVSLGEGNTPLVRLYNLEQKLNNKITWYAKVEGYNPTGSFKDRGMAVAISRAKELGSKIVLCASTGNTSASAAAFAARANMQAIVLIPEGKIALGKLAQAMIHGAKVIQIQGNFDDAMQMVKDLSAKHPITLVNSVNPYRLEGQKTAAFEIVDCLERAPDYHCLPVGNAGNISAYWMGYNEYFKDKKFNNMPKMVGYQAEGAAPFVLGKPISAPETVATAIRIGSPQSWEKANMAADSTQGWFKACSDQQILAAQSLLAATEGIFCEPASAAAIAGVLDDVNDGLIKSDSLVVSTLTGHGLKDPDIAIQQHQDKILTVESTLNAVEQSIANYLG